VPRRDADLAVGQQPFSCERLDDVLAVQAVNGRRLDAGHLAQSHDHPDHAAGGEAFGRGRQDRLGSGALLAPEQNAFERLLDRPNRVAFDCLWSALTFPDGLGQCEERFRCVDQEKSLGSRKLEPLSELGRIAQGDVRRTGQLEALAAAQPTAPRTRRPMAPTIKPAVEGSQRDRTR